MVGCCANKQARKGKGNGVPFNRFEGHECITTTYIHSDGVVLCYKELRGGVSKRPEGEVRCSCSVQCGSPEFGCLCCIYAPCLHIIHRNGGKKRLRNVVNRRSIEIEEASRISSQV